MMKSSVHLKIVKWTARIIGSLMFLFIVPFYVGYGLPIPRASYTFYENLHLSIIPIMLAGLLIGWKREKIAGFMICIPITIALIYALITWGYPGPIVLMLAIPGGLYLYYGYINK